MFQSTHPRGVRRITIYPVPCIYKVSIHAPARGATCPVVKFTRPLECFNPRTREGCDDKSAPLLSVRVAFQSTHPRGVRPKFLDLVPVLIQFQSTHPRGVRLYQGLGEMLGYLEFQSTHPRGVRLIMKLVIVLLTLFQSTHPRGVRPYFFNLEVQGTRFNPRTREGCDLHLPT